LLKRLLHNASEQRAFFALPVVAQSGFEHVYSRLADAASALYGRFRATGLSVDSLTTAAAFSDSKASCKVNVLL
jgi:hypothetical protein